MKKKKTIMCIILVLTIIIVTNFLSIKITVLITSIDKDYQKLGLKIEDYDIDYCTTYLEDILGVYKVYKINDYYEGDGLDSIEGQLESNELWSKNKYYEYIMMRFYEVEGKEYTEIDRENLYYYHGKDAYAIIDIKNAKLYYYNYCIFGSSDDYNKILDIKIDNYTAKEVYSIKGGWQGDGTDYYTYQFTEEKGKEIEDVLTKQQDWSKEKLAEDIIDCFKYNEEVYSIENGYYHYKKICRTSDEEKKYNFTDEEATGYKVGIYDIDTNKLYYYWTSF